jgi:hypothetical protein
MGAPGVGPRAMVSPVQKVSPLPRCTRTSVTRALDTPSTKVGTPAPTCLQVMPPPTLPAHNLGTCWWPYILLSLVHLCVDLKRVYTYPLGKR